MSSHERHMPSEPGYGGCSIQPGAHRSGILALETAVVRCGPYLYSNAGKVRLKARFRRTHEVVSDRTGFSRVDAIPFDFLASEEIRHYGRVLMLKGQLFSSVEHLVGIMSQTQSMSSYRRAGTGARHVPDSSILAGNGTPNTQSRWKGSRTAR